MTIEQLQKMTTTIEQRMDINRKKAINIIEEIKNKKDIFQIESIDPSNQTIIKGDFLFGTKYTIDEEEYYFWLASSSAYIPPHSIASGKREGNNIYVISKSKNDDLQFNVLDSTFHSIYNQPTETLDVHILIDENELSLIQKGIESIYILNKKLLNPIYEKEKVKERKRQ